jgi:hypothetical protein
MRIERTLLALSLLFAATGCQRGEDIKLTPWFEVHYGRPAVDMPHMLQIGDYKSEARMRLDGAWEVVSKSGRALDAVPLDGGRKVLVREGYGDWRIFMEGQREPKRLPEELCPSSAYVSPDGQRIFCPDAMGQLSARRVRLRTFDTAGQLLSESEVEFPGPEGNAAASVQLVGFLSVRVPVFATEFDDGDDDSFTDDCGLVSVDEGGPHILYPLHKVRGCHDTFWWPDRVPNLGLQPPLASSMDRLKR